MKELLPLLAYTILLFHHLSVASIPLPSSELLSKQKEGLVVELIHRDFSSLSPFYNSSMTQTEIFLNAAIRSKYRAESINSIVLNYHLSQASDYSPIVPIEGGFLMYLYIGTPPVESLVTADTGSDLTWVQCLPCDQCYPQNSAIFDPQKSSTQCVVPCNRVICERYIGFDHFCSDNFECKYKMSYGDKSVSIGVVMQETVSFNKERTMSYPYIIMGCGQENSGIFDPKEVGIAGLGGEDVSLMSQVLYHYNYKKKFAYCFDLKASTKLFIGVDTQTNKTNVVTTPMVKYGPFKTFYYLGLEGVKVQNTVLKPLKPPDVVYSEGIMIIDSGTTLTHLSQSLYDIVEDAIVDFMDEQCEPIDPIEPYTLCYRNSEIIYFPDISFQFAASAELKFNINNMLMILPQDTACLAIIPTDWISILGSYSLASFNVEYDLEQKTISFASADCSKE